jgi:DNA-binding winged helix-turn-helix (wHTH) protein/tetratricopeptide (TPR) repeat protein
MSSERRLGTEGSGSTSPDVVYFDPFAFDTTACRLSRDGVEIHLTPKAAAVLCYLLRKPGSLISKNEFLEVVWEGVHVREESLTQAISVIRQALGDSAQSPQFIQTISGEGYRFIGQVSSLPASGRPGVPSRPGTASVGASPSVSVPPPRRHRYASVWRHGVIAAVLSGAVVATSAYFLATPPSVDLPTIVVLPATVIGQTEDQRLFAMGIADELERKLATVTPGVVPYSVAMSYERAGKTWAQIAQHFEVDYILELSVRFGPPEISTFRVNSRLLRGSGGLPLWEGAYDGAVDSLGFLDQQAEAAIAVIETLSLELPVGTRQMLVAWPTDDLTAWQEYLRGMELLRGPIYDRRMWAESIAHFQEAVKHDPDYLVARAMLARAAARSGNPERWKLAEEVARSLVEEHPDLPQAHWALGDHYYQAAIRSIRDEAVDSNEYYALAQDHLDQARRSLPYSLDLEFSLSQLMLRRGRWRDQQRVLERLLRRQPDSLEVLSSLGWSYLKTRNHGRAQELFARYFELNPSGNGPYPANTDNYLAWGVPLSKLRAVLQAMSSVQPKKCAILASWILLDAAERDFRRLIPRREEAAHCRTVWFGNMPFSFDLYAALAYRELGAADEAKATLEIAREYSENELAQHPGWHGMHAAIGLIYAMQSSRDDALAHAHTAMDMWPISQDAFQGDEAVLFYVRTLAQLGRPEDLEEAIDRLDELLSIPTTVTIPFIRNDPFMDPIVAHPRFQQLVDKYPQAGYPGDEAGQP